MYKIWKIIDFFFQDLSHKLGHGYKKGYLSDKGTYGWLLFYPESLVKECRSRAWIRYFIQNFEGLIQNFDGISRISRYFSRVKFPFLSGFGFEIEFFGAMTENR